MPNTWHLNDNLQEKIYKSKNNLDNGILQADFMIRKIFDGMKEKGYLQNAVVVFTSDHGDELGEFGQFHHKTNLNWTTLNIPLMFYGIDSNKFVNKKFARLIDVAPTLVEAADYPIPSSWEGKSLLSHLPDSFSYHQTYLKSKVNMYYSIVYYTVEGTYRYQFNHDYSMEALYKISVDRTEQHNIINTNTAIADKLRNKSKKEFDKIFWIPQY